MVAYTKPQHRKKEESERIRGEKDQIKFIDLRVERWKVVAFWKARRRQDPKVDFMTLRSYAYRAVSLSFLRM